MTFIIKQPHWYKKFRVRVRVRILGLAVHLLLHFLFPHHGGLVMAASQQDMCVCVCVMA